MKVNKTVESTVGFYASNIDDLLEDVKNRYYDLLNYNKINGTDVTSLSITDGYEYGAPVTMFEIRFEREETEKEKNQRLKLEADNAIWRKKQYESLKKEFERK